MVSFLHLLLISAPLLVLFLFKKYISSNNNHPPGPRGLPIIGNLHQLDSSKLHLQLWDLSKIYGPLFSLQIGLKPAIVISSPKLAKEVLKDHDRDVSSRPPHLGNQKMSYNGLEMIFSPYDDYWREIKKICVVHFFSSKPLSSFSHVRDFEVMRMIKKISSSKTKNETTNLSDITMSASSAMICRMAFGRRYEDEGVERSRFHWLLNEAQAMSIAFFFSDYIPCIGWVIDKLTGSLARLKNTCKGLDAFFEEVIDAHLDPKWKKLEGGTKDQEDIVDVLLQLKNQGRLPKDFSYNHIKAIIMDFLIAGTDTSAATTVWLMTGLMKNPRVMKKVQEEVRNLYGKKEFINEDDIQKLVYLKAVIKETLRFYAPAPLLTRETNKSVIVDGYQIQPKTLVYVNGWAVQRDPETWKDPEEFYPERFLNNDIDFKGQDFEMIAFGAGRRICAGIPLGIATVELMTANLLNSFDWELPEGVKSEDIDTDGLPGLAQHKKNHLCLVAKKHR